MPRVPWQSLYPKAHPLALDLLDKLLQFDPARRLDCVAALRHPYFARSEDQAAALAQAQALAQQQQQQQQQQMAEQQMYQQQHGGKVY